MTTKTKAIMGLGLVAGLGAAVLPLASYADSDTADAEVRVSVDESITITGINNQALGLTFDGGMISDGDVETGTHTVTVSTSAAAGYILTMQSDTAGLTKLVTAGSPNVYGGAVGFDAIGAGGGVTAPNAANAYNEATLTGAGVTFSATAPNTGVWGYRLSGWTANNFVSVPTTATTIAASNAPAAAQATVVTFGAQAGTTTGAGTYGAFITYVATTN